MSDKYISQEQMERIRSARIKYEEALFTKQGVPQAKTTLGNLLISSVGGILSMIAGAERRAERGAGGKT